MRSGIAFRRWGNPFLHACGPYNSTRFPFELKHTRCASKHLLNNFDGSLPKLMKRIKNFKCAQANKSRQKDHKREPAQTVERKDSLVQAHQSKGTSALGDGLTVFQRRVGMQDFNSKKRTPTSFQVCLHQGSPSRPNTLGERRSFMCAGQIQH